MKIVIISLITIVMMVQLSFGVFGCHPKPMAVVKLSPKMKPKNLKNNQTIANGTITFNMKDQLGEGRTADVYAGQTKNGTKVAVKFFADDEVALESYSIELKCFEKLGATIDDKCKMYGIPPILFHGPGAGYHVLVLPLYSSTLCGLEEKNITVSDKSWLSMMQQMVVTIKYMHSKGVIHGDIHDENMMVDLNQVYLIDYGFNHFKKKKEANDMLQMFISICHFFKLRNLMREKAEKVGRKIAKQKEQIIKEIKSRKTINPDYVRPLVEFAIEAVNANVTKRLPNYDKLYRILDEALYPNGDHSERVVFNFLSDAEKAIARKIPIVPIESIKIKKRRFF